MTIKHVVILSEKSLQTSLMDQQLSAKLDISLEVVSAKMLVTEERDKPIDLILVDFEQLEFMVINQTLPNFDLLKLDILIYNMPKDELLSDYLYWQSLRGILLSCAPIDHLSKSVAYVLSGGLWLPRKCLEELVQLRRNPNLERCQLYNNLTTRERQILDHVASGKSNKQIANTLFLSESTVKSHVYKIFKKLDVHKRRDAMHITKAVNNNHARFD
ncbi:DNA-binding response regulator [Vibrio ponticus]|uniref:DNA-binding response regulator n=2 Tax=Vibrio ponticus TaxID=265668 RepID=A0A3N3DWP9_9VIBR|nr:DNA-binding response regulator [Vibrio ponticus]